jgi:hypothetical protein
MHDFGWDGDTAHFDAYLSIHTEQLEADSRAGGRIRLIPAFDSMIAVNGTWQYSWPNTAIGTTDISLSIEDVQAEELVTENSAHGSNVGIGPPFGAFSLQNSGQLLAGREYFLDYFTQLYFFDAPPPGTQGNASGEIHFAITPVPEPDTLSMLAAGFLIIPRHKRRGRC